MGLPTELVYEVLKNLENSEKAKMCFVSRKMFKMCETSKIIDFSYIQKIASRANINDLSFVDKLKILLYADLIRKSNQYESILKYSVEGFNCY